MRNYPAFVTVVALLLSSCSSGPPALPEDVVGSAATCAAVAASKARAALPDLSKPLSIDQQSQVIHYALLAGAADPKFSRENANSVVKQMQTIAGQFDDDEWQPLAPLCKTAFPEADASHTVALPAVSEEAQMQCYALGDFMVRALGAYNETYQDAVVKYNGMLGKLEPAIKEQLSKNGIVVDDHVGQSAEKSKALALAAKLGPPSKTLDACVKQFPSDGEVKLPT
jgi:hypothetical protein